MRTIGELYNAKPIIEVDDYIAGFMMVSAISGAVPELKAQYLAQWAARLREHYVEIGRELGRSDVAESLRDECDLGGDVAWYQIARVCGVEECK